MVISSQQESVDSLAEVLRPSSVGYLYKHSTTTMSHQLVLLKVSIALGTGDFDFKKVTSLMSSLCCDNISRVEFRCLCHSSWQTLLFV